MMSTETVAAAPVVAKGVSKDGLDIPLIDFGRFLDGGGEERIQVADAISNAFRNAGFIYLKNHGIPQDTISQVFETSAEFFNRPQAEKDALCWTSPQSNRGYVSYGREKVSLPDERENLATQAPDMKETFEIGRDNHEVYANRWPPPPPPSTAGGDGGKGTSNNKFTATMTSFYQTCQSLHEQVMSALALSLGFDESYFLPSINKADNNLRLLHYPPVAAEVFSASATAPARVRTAKHSDYGTITLLFQDMSGGLQVNSPRGSWVDVTPIAGTVVVNAGDLLNRWSNGSIASTQHRVVEPPSKPIDGMFPARYSVAYFCNPNSDAWIEALPGTFSDEKDKKFPGIKAFDYLVESLGRTFNVY